MFVVGNRFECFSSAFAPTRNLRFCTAPSGIADIRPDAQRPDLSVHALVRRHSDLVSLCKLPEPALIEVGLSFYLFNR